LGSGTRGVSSGNETSMTSNSARIAVVGDLHSDWHQFDVAHLNRSDCSLVLLTGDLSAGGRRDGLSIARSLSRLERRTLVMPGNNDVPDYAQVAAELSYQRGRTGLMALSRHQTRPCVETVGYDCRTLELGGRKVSIISGRPFAMGGSEFSFPAVLGSSFDVHSLAQSTERLKVLVDEAPSNELLFLGHNGPLGVGAEPDAAWGRDFGGVAGDWGDSDLRDAVAHARASGRRVLAVVAGHMHWRLRNGGTRRWQATIDDVLYVNAARVPRIFPSDGGFVHHYVELTIEAGGVTAAEVLVRRIETPPTTAA
jgi:uncharacterized protein (TIGR04168 family)